VNVAIAIIQTYESYIKIGEIVSKSLSSSLAFKKLADNIFCETSIPVENRIANGITFLRDCFGRYQAILDQSPPLEFHGKKPTDLLEQAQNIANTIREEMRISRSMRENAELEIPEENPQRVFIDMKTRLEGSDKEPTRS
jgi:hypothetical protein